MKSKVFRLLMVSFMMALLAGSIFVAPAPTEAIVGGIVASNPQPAVPLLEIKYVDLNDKSQTKNCTGSLIDPRWIVTAVHCVDDVDTDKHNWRELPNDVITAKFYTASESFTAKSNLIVRQKDVDPESGANDLALVRLEHAVTSVAPIPIVDGNIFGLLKLIFRFGYGVTEPTSHLISDKLRYSIEKIIPCDQPRDLQYRCRSTLNGWVDSNALFTTAIGEGGAGPGDSGGPVFVKAADGSYALAGVTSGILNNNNSNDNYPDPRTLKSDFIGLSNRVDSRSQGFSFIKDTFTTYNVPLPQIVAGQLATHQWGADYANWKFDGPGNDFWNVDQYVRVMKKNAFTFWAQQFTFTGANYGGYIGFQTDGGRMDGKSGELAIFSLWNANGVRGGNCGTFTDEGDGMSCRIPLTIHENYWYRFRVWRQETDSQGQWWGAWIKSIYDNYEYFIGGIRVPLTTPKLVGDVVNFSEYFGPPVPCNQVPQSVIDLTQPAANSNGDNVNTYQRYSKSSGWSKASCTNGMGSPMNYVTTNGLRLTLGGHAVTTATQDALQSAINEAAVSNGVVIIDPSVTSIDLHSTLNIPQNVKILADCNKRVTLYSGNTNPVQLNGNNNLQGLIVQGSKGLHITNNGRGNTFTCFLVSIVPSF
jgi:hypothetical protein